MNFTSKFSAWFLLRQRSTAAWQSTQASYQGLCLFFCQKGWQNLFFTLGASLEAGARLLVLSLPQELCYSSQKAAHSRRLIWSTEEQQLQTQPLALQERC